MLPVAAGFLVVVWIWLLVVAATDLLRRDDLSAGGKAAWALLLVALPYAGVLAYVAREGGGMAERRKAPSEELRRSLRAIAVSAADELAKLEGLRARKAISPSEYNRLRSRFLE
jgi:hypothetical protein